MEKYNLKYFSLKDNYVFLMFLCIIVLFCIKIMCLILNYVMYINICVCYKNVVLFV